MLHRWEHVASMHVFLSFNELTYWGRKMQINWRASLVIIIIISTNHYMNQQSFQNSDDPLVPDHHNFIRTSKYLHLLVPMSTSISTSYWCRTYWVLRCSKFCLGPSKFDNLGDQCSVKLSAILSQPQPAWCHIHDPTNGAASLCHILIKCYFI